MTLVIDFSCCIISTFWGLFTICVYSCGGDTRSTEVAPLSILMISFIGNFDYFRSSGFCFLGPIGFLGENKSRFRSIAAFLFFYLSLATF